MKIEFPKININHEPKIDISQKVLARIEKRKIKITERWIFWAKKLGFGSGLVLTNIIIIIVINLILYYLQKTGGILYLSFGIPALTLILKNIPFSLIILIIALFILNKYLLKRTELIYQKYYHKIIICLLIISIGLGFFLFFSGINQALERSVAASQKRIFLISEIYKGRIPCLPEDRSGVIGKVIDKDTESLTIQTLDKQKKIIISAPKDQIASIYEEQIVAAVGTGGESIFVADKVKVITTDLVVQCLGNIK